MEYLFLLSLLVTGAFAPGHQNHHEQQTIINCFGTMCTDHHTAYCNINVHGNSYTGACYNPHECDHYCGVPGRHGCCCYDQACVDDFTNHVISQTSKPLTCYECHDLSNCNQHLHTCNINDVCMFRLHHTHIEASCTPNRDCIHARHDSWNHKDQYVTCCVDNNCTQAVMHQYHTGAGISLHCTTCHDILTNDCNGDQTCANNEVCMVRHIDQRIESRCIKAEECTTPHGNVQKICCNTLDCAQKAVSAAKQVNVVPSTTVPPHICNDVEDASFKCSDYVRDFDICNQPTVTSKMLANTRCKKSCGLCQQTTVCSDKEDGNFSCADYIRDFDICHKVDGTGLSLALTKCQKSCGLCPGNGFVQTTDVAGTPSPAPTVPQTTLQPSTTTQAPTNPQTTTQAPTKLMAVTTAKTTKPPCVDHDVQNACTAYSFYFCSATTGQARDFAVANCAKTCNLCNEFFASLTVSNFVG